MPLFEPYIPEKIDPKNLLLIVTGAGLRAETADRVLAYQLQAKILQWINSSVINVDVQPIVCSDIWYINNENLHDRPVISLGGPGVNALSAYFAQQLNTTHMQNGQMVLQMDHDLVDLRICLWGMDHQMTVEAIELFETKHFERYLRAVVNQVEPQID